jgi:hypothetical protein
MISCARNIGKDDREKAEKSVLFLWFSTLQRNFPTAIPLLFYTSSRLSLLTQKLQKGFPMIRGQNTKSAAEIKSVIEPMFYGVAAGAKFAQRGPGAGRLLGVGLIGSEPLLTDKHINILLSYRRGD